jgi:endonuclease-3 related protein
MSAAGDLASLRPALLASRWGRDRRQYSAYALAKPTFVVDAYTFRILSRHGLINEGCAYEELRQLFMEHLAAHVPLYQEYHALLVRLGKEGCRPQPCCASLSGGRLAGE